MRTSADLAAAVADTSVIVALLVSHISLTGEILIPSGRSLTISGSTTDCLAGGQPLAASVSAALAAVGASALCTLDAGSQSRALTVQRGAALTLSSVCVANGQSAGPGGAVYFSGATLSLQGAQVLSSASAGYGGGVAGESGCALLAADSLIALNTGSADGGGLAISACASVSIVRTRFSNNTAVVLSRGGGGAVIERTPLAVLDGVTFDSNRNVDAGAFASGGALTINAVASPLGPNGALVPLQIRNSVFRNNKRASAARIPADSVAARVRSHSPCPLHWSLRCQDMPDLRPIFASDSSNPPPVNLFPLCSADRGFGGALIYMSHDGGRSLLEVSNTLFDSNRGATGGGGSHSAPMSEVRYTDCTWVNNRATGSAGAFAAYYMNVTVLRGRFENNTCAGSGGAIRTKHWVGLTIADSTFTGNVAGESGGALSVSMGAIALQTLASKARVGALSLCHAFRFSPLALVYNGKGFSALPLCCHARPPFHLPSLIPGANTIISGSLFSGNVASTVNGGAVSSVQASPLAILGGVNITGNRASKGGGGVFFDHFTQNYNTQYSHLVDPLPSVLSVRDSTVEGNTAGQTGGGVQATQLSAVQMVNAVVRNNSATGGGSGGGGLGGGFCTRAESQLNLCTPGSVSMLYDLVRLDHHHWVALRLHKADANAPGQRAACFCCAVCLHCGAACRCLS